MPPGVCPGFSQERAGEHRPGDKILGLLCCLNRQALRRLRRDAKRSTISRRNTAPRPVKVGDSWAPV